MSLWQRPVASTRSTAPPGCGSGTGRSRSSHVSSPLKTIARLIGTPPAGGARRPDRLAATAAVAIGAHALSSGGRNGVAARVLCARSAILREHADQLERDDLGRQMPHPAPTTDLGSRIPGLTGWNVAYQQRERVLGAALLELRVELVGILVSRARAFVPVTRRNGAVGPTVLRHAGAVTRIGRHVRPVGTSVRGRLPFFEDGPADRLALLPRHYRSARN